MDKYALGRDIGALEVRVRLLEERLKKSEDCGCGSKNVKPDGAIEYGGIAEVTKSPVTPKITPKAHAAAALHEAQFTDGQTRRIWDSGNCYCQMLCGGTWYYFCYDNGYCVLCPGGITVNCNGTSRQLRC